MPTNMNPIRSLVRPATNERLYGIVDAAQDRELAFEAKCIFNQPFDSLLEGAAAAALADVAPYLVGIDLKSEYLERWHARFGKNCGILLLSKLNFQELLVAMRRLLHISDENGRKFLFRFYDPRVFAAYVESCDREERCELNSYVSTVIFQEGGSSYRCIEKEDLC